MSTSMIIIRDRHGRLLTSCPALPISGEVNDSGDLLDIKVGLKYDQIYKSS